MLQYLGDIMEDASDLSWQSAKACHAVVLCKMEREKVKWDDTVRLDWLRQAYAQNYQFGGKQNWGTKPFEKSHGSAKISKVTPAHMGRTMSWGKDASAYLCFLSVVGQAA